MTVNTDGSAILWANNGAGAGATQAGTIDSTSVSDALQAGGTGLAGGSNGPAYPSSTGQANGNVSWYAYNVPRIGGGTRYIIVQQLTPTGGATSSPQHGVISVFATQ